MKNKFSTSWASSKQPRKQRKYRANAPLHLRRKMVSANLSKKLKEQYKKRSMPVVQGDTVKIMRGEFKDMENTVQRVDRKNYKLEIEKVEQEKPSGETVPVKIAPSNVQITKLNKEDKLRIKALKR